MRARQQQPRLRRVVMLAEAEDLGHAGHWVIPQSGPGGAGAQGILLNLSGGQLRSDFAAGFAGLFGSLGTPSSPSSGAATRTLSPRVVESVVHGSPLTRPLGLSSDTLVQSSPFIGVRFPGAGSGLRSSGQEFDTSLVHVLPRGRRFNRTPMGNQEAGQLFLLKVHLAIF